MPPTPPPPPDPSPSRRRVREEDETLVFELLGDVDEDDARRTIEEAQTAAEHRPVAIDLAGAASVSEEGAAALLFWASSARRCGDGISLRTSGSAGREAVLRAYARRRVRTARPS